MPSFRVGQTAILATTATGDTTSTGDAIYGNYHGGESNLFGTAAQVYSNFTEYAWNHNNGGDAVNATQSDVGLLNTGYTWAANPQQAFLLNQYKMINALPYVGKTDGITTHWRIRNGARDRDTSFTVAYNLSRALKADAKVKDVDFAAGTRGTPATMTCRAPSAGSTRDWLQAIDAAQAGFARRVAFRVLLVAARALARNLPLHHG
jgi:hypothetical protein